MGLDGGSIPSRTDVLRRSSWKVSNMNEAGVRRSTRGAQFQPNFVMKESLTTEETNQLKVAKTSVCALSNQPLADNIVCCGLGYLYNKDTVIEYITGLGMFENNKQKYDEFSHLVSLRSVRSVKFQKNPNFDPTKASADNTDAPCRFNCSVSGLPFNGHYDFVVLPCGHAFADRAIKNVKSNTCCTCEQKFEKNEVIPLFPTGEVYQARKKIVDQEAAEFKAKKEKKRKHEPTTTTDEVKQKEKKTSS
eukprot:c11632_g1_i1.p1 GENE.c11632_g1_i1~~c11632_g1_i1.p1  ORF type:complete len:248 (-),score=101.83 c11632_g1_i1:153-896(-)